MTPLCLCHRRVSRPDLYRFTISCFEWRGNCLSCSTLWAVTTTLSKQPESAQCLSKLSQSLDKHLREKLWPLNHLQTSSWCIYLYENMGIKQHYGIMSNSYFWPRKFSLKIEVWFCFGWFTLHHRCVHNISCRKYISWRKQCTYAIINLMYSLWISKFFCFF